MRDSNPGQDQKTNIVCNEQKVLPRGLGLPSDEPIPIFNLKGRRCPAQTGNYLAFEKNQVSQMFPKQSGTSEIMIVMNQGSSIGNSPGKSLTLRKVRHIGQGSAPMGYWRTGGFE